MTRQRNLFFIFNLLLFCCLLTIGCSKTYYSAMEKVGVHKRDILIDRVEGARDSQASAQQQFKSALEQFGSVIQLENTDLKKAYELLDEEYTDCEKAARKVTHRIDKVENVSDALFDEWEDELNLYENKELRRSSKRQLKITRARYEEMLRSMRTAEASMTPVLKTFRDNVLFLKHNLNAQAIGSLQSEFTSLEKDIDDLIKKMNTAIGHSNDFIAHMGN
jgi:sugar-specific transcriptional regulator TrmB